MRTDSELSLLRRNAELIAERDAALERERNALHALSQMTEYRAAAREEVSVLIEQLDHMQVERDAALERVKKWEVGLGAPDFQTVRANLNNAQHQSGQHALVRIEAQLASAQAQLLDYKHMLTQDGIPPEFLSTDVQLRQELRSAQTVIDAAIKAIDSWLDIDGETYEEWEAALAAHLERYPR